MFSSVFLLIFPLQFNDINKEKRLGHNFFYVYNCNKKAVIGRNANKCSQFLDTILTILILTYPLFQKGTIFFQKSEYFLNNIHTIQNKLISSVFFLLLNHYISNANTHFLLKISTKNIS